MSLQAQEKIIKLENRLKGMRWYYPKASFEQADEMLLDEKRIEDEIETLKKMIKE